MAKHKETPVAKQHRTTVTSDTSGAAAAKGLDPAVAASPRRAADRAEIARLAYSYWQARGCPDGSPEEDWLRAEADLGDRKPLIPSIEPH